MTVMRALVGLTLSWVGVAELFTMEPSAMSASAPASAGPSVSAAWARATPRLARAGAVFLTLRGGSQDNAVVAASASAIAERIELHRHIIVGDVARMTSVERITIAANATAALQPMGDHIMLIGLRRPLIDGQVFTLDLHWADGQRSSTQVRVTAMSATSAPASCCGARP